ncbi:MAG: hypothetical protein R3A12_12025 [Ignavibacteria bacterium]
MDINAGNVNVTRLIITFAQFMFILVPAVILVMLHDNNIKETFRLTETEDVSLYSCHHRDICHTAVSADAFMYYQTP